ncbi:MAG TPA: hypothetical protein VNT26_05980, partial [Candidatus Sulfotelmatobacter sp.]|nr:hypothetical protein [Candidatus Sulfotelmatobacter sp.]
MDEPFELLDPHGAQLFLKELPPEARRKGEACFRAGRVQVLVPKKPGLSYSARVQDARIEEVELDYDAVEGWDGICSCKQQFDCEHVFAAMSALLAEHRAATVRNLSAVSPSGMSLPAARLKPTPADTEGLARRLMVATGRALTKQENQFVRKVHEIYQRCSQTRYISYWEFQQMGLPLLDYGWGGLQIWPAFPNNEYEFWLYIANALQERKLPLPEFMEPITDLSLIRDRLERWRRSREVEKWKQLLGNFQVQSSETPGAHLGETDLRVLIEAKEAHLQWLRPGHSLFEPLKQSPLQQMAQGIEQGRVRLTPEAELIWQLFAQRNAYYYQVSPKISYIADDAPRLLGRLLRLRLLDSRVVNQAGQPLARPAEPLRWELTPAASAEEDYRLRLVQADGS